MDFANGQPCWIDASVPDAAAREGLMAFLGSLFGWTYDVGPPETGSYTMAMSEGAPVAALGEFPEGAGFWTTYLRADDIEVTAGKVVEHGGQVFMGPMQVMDAGWMALAVDPVGAIFGLWQPIEFAGFEAYGRAGAACWFDHVSTDTQRAADFYSATFDRPLARMDGDGSLLVMAGDDGVASFSGAPEGAPAAWMPIIGVASVDEAEIRATAAGGSILASRMEVPGGIASVVSAPGVGTVTIVYESPDL